MPLPSLACRVTSTAAPLPLALPPAPTLILLPRHPEPLLPGAHVPEGLAARPPCPVPPPPPIDWASSPTDQRPWVSSLPLLITLTAACESGLTLLPLTRSEPCPPPTVTAWAISSSGAAASGS